MENEKTNLSRKKFIRWSVAVSSLLAFPALLKFSGKRKEQSKSVKMLTQDGRLVEIELVHIPSRRKKIRTADIANWIKRKRKISS